ncbi:MAG: FAD-dependent monooxygenase [Pseudomonadota bacterium]
MSSEQNQQQRAIIIGGSMAGLFAAINLINAGWRVDIYERAGAPLVNRGAGIATHNELYAAVESAGIQLRDEMGVHSNGRVMFDRDGVELARCDMPQRMTSWGFIFRFLREKIPDNAYHLGKSLCGIEQRHGNIEASFEDGTKAIGDWLIGADGTRSTTRQLLAPEIEAEYCGYLGWRGLIDESLIEPSVHTAIAHKMAFSMAPGGHWLGYLVAGPNDTMTPGNRWYNWAWYRTTPAAQLRDALTDDNGKYYPLGIPHTLIRREIVEKMRAESKHYLAPQAQAVIKATAEPFIQGMYDFVVPQMRFNQAILIGDAAFTARPHVGLGVSKAADDASKLALALSAQDQDSALAAWEESRVRFGRAAVQWGRDLGSYIGPQPDSEEHRRKAIYHMQPEILTTATAANDPMRYLAPLIES